jgi:predicted HAD superfamily phosphohydrolase
VSAAEVAVLRAEVAALAAEAAAMRHIVDLFYEASRADALGVPARVPARRRGNLALVPPGKTRDGGSCAG